MPSVGLRRLQSPRHRMVQRLVVEHRHLAVGLDREDRLEQGVRVDDGALVLPGAVLALALRGVSGWMSASDLLVLRRDDLRRLLEQEERLVVGGDREAEEADVVRDLRLLELEVLLRVDLVHRAAAAVEQDRVLALVPERPARPRGRDPPRPWGSTVSQTRRHSL